MVYYQITRLGYFSPNEVQKSIDWLAANPNDTMKFYILPATLAAFHPEDPHTFPGKARKNLATDLKGTIAYTQRQLAPTTNWKEHSLKATTRANKTPRRKSSNLRFGVPSRVDAFTYLATALIQFHKRTHITSKGTLADEFKLPILNMCDVLIRSLLTCASSELRKIKQRQEDVLASVQTDWSSMFKSAASVSGEIEGQPAPRNTILPHWHPLCVPPARTFDATRGLSYMEITEMSVGKLPLFLQWATWSMQVRDENMTTALYDMLSGLAKG
ncbi:hypothetical protein EV363DRAFT_1403165 [Boletus edulis]|nr:hypothetical protein EV363DRAFT_1403165 [Boletus edulis]